MKLQGFSVGAECHDDILREVEDIYMVSFPAEERRPWPDFQRLLSSEPRFSLNVAIGADGRVEGFITVWKLESAVYIEHFAVSPHLRRQGIGQKILRSFMDSMAEGTEAVLEVEPGDYGNEACRRIEFYKRAGFRDYPDFPYVQPPYAPSLPSVPLMLMSGYRGLSRHVLEKVASEIHKHVYGC